MNVGTTGTGEGKGPPPLPGGHRLGRPARLLRLLILAGAGLFAWVWVMKPLGGWLLRGTCGFHALTGLPCGLCGATRATRALLEGNWSRALELNALAVPVALFLLATMAVVLLEAVSGRRLIPVWPVGMRVFLAVCCMAVLLVWTGFQIRSAIQTRNGELVNFDHPLVRFFDPASKGN